MHCPQCVKEHSQYNEDNASMPEKAQDQVENMDNDMQKISKNHESNDEPD